MKTLAPAHQPGFATNSLCGNTSVRQPHPQQRTSRTKIAALVVAALLAVGAMTLAACQPAPTEPASLPSLSPSETPMPAVAPTATPIPSPKALGEPLAISVEQVAGRWAFRLAGGGGNDPAVLTLAPDGTTSMDGSDGYHKGINVGRGTFWFEGDTLMLYSDECVNARGFFTCTAKYQVFLSNADGTPGALRFVALEDPHPDRKKSLHNKTLSPAPPD